LTTGGNIKELNKMKRMMAKYTSTSAQFGSQTNQGKAFKPKYPLKYRNPVKYTNNKEGPDKSIHTKIKNVYVNTFGNKSKKSNKEILKMRSKREGKDNQKRDKKGNLDKKDKIKIYHSTSKTRGKLFF
jgi:hypothetical protein